ncbi:MAG: twin-arginine translocase TatA/TatE family subunit [Treponema sp.]|nr:twin-arginine translocase TatA/TatE family subunit [Treponema sp.]
MNLGIGQIALLIVLALVLFGPKRLPEMGRAVGNALREFKSALGGANSPEKKSEEVSSGTAKAGDKGDENV